MTKIHFLHKISIKVSIDHAHILIVSSSTNPAYWICWDSVNVRTQVRWIVNCAVRDPFHCKTDVYRSITVHTEAHRLLGIVHRTQVIDTMVTALAL